MIYPVNLFAGIKKMPFFYSNFVQTIDGKVTVRNKDGRKYWPIGSQTDFETLLWLRAHADVLIHGKKTAIEFRTLQTLAKKCFREKRLKLGKKEDLIYMVLSNHPDDKLFKALANPPRGVKSCLVTRGLNVINTRGYIALNLGVEVLKLGESNVDLKKLSVYSRKNNLKKILIEGGPTLMASFLKENLIDEMFITISPKILGNMNNQSITMVENHLFPPLKTPRFKLISVKNIDSELYLRYRKQNWTNTAVRH